MPALQVRDFPDELYSRLKESAAANHRSIAQQTIAFVENALAEPGSRDGHDSLQSPWVRQLGLASCIAPAEQHDRLLRALERADRLRWIGDAPSNEEIVNAIRSSRNDLDERNGMAAL